MGSTEAEPTLEGQVEIRRYMFGYADSMVLKCAVELRIADIIHSHSGPITLSQIASSIDQHSLNNSVDIACLERLMRFLVRRRIFIAHPRPEGGETVYGLTESSKWLLHDSELSLAPLILTVNHFWFTSPWQYFSKSVKEGGTAFQKAHGLELWDFASQNVECNTIFNNGVACDSRIASKAIIQGYKDGFESIGSLVDVGGGIGGIAAQIVKSYPHIKAINYDLPHVIATAPLYDGVSHLGGDMFESIPNADAVLMKCLLHDWSDTDCVKILKNCRKAIPEKTGRLIIVEVVLQPDGSGLFDDIGFVSDLAMLAITSGGKERTEHEWKKLLEEGGFPSNKIIKIPALLSIIEAYPY